MSRGPRYRLPRLLLLLAGGTPTMEELIAGLGGAGRRSIEEDLVALEEGGIGIQRIQAGGDGRRGRAPTRYTLTAETRRQLTG